eukprot:TRINITY_DN19267_c0_g1_i2.p1 TRINITY_DN19267_c0_g1~~TRINITY_DN19267_c0_g1_i2.p1  ORF type:complete len:466 (+),score=51.89 TRINITY_DN19267_c0_g1_i2:34-1431(+)
MVLLKGLRARKAALKRRREAEKGERRRAKKAGIIVLNERRMSLTRRVIYLKPNPKHIGASKARYQRYMHASTMQEALRLGSSVGDIKYDFGKGFLRFPKGGRVEQAELPKGARRPPKGTSLGKDNAFAVCLGGTECWVPKTQKLCYVSNPKSKGSDAYKRYAKYQKAKTLQQAMQLGAAFGDVQHDHKRGYLSFPSGLVAEPLPPCSVAKEDQERVKELNVKWRARARQLLRLGKASAKAMLEKVKQKIDAARQTATKRRSEEREPARGVKRKRPAQPGSDYTIVIPSYPHDKRIKILQSHTLAFLRRQQVPLSRIHLVVANAAESQKYRNSLGEHAPKIHVGCPGVVEVRTWIVKHFREGAHILSIDDDVKDVMCKQKNADIVRPLQPGGLDRLVANADRMMKAEGANLWALNCGKQVRNMRHNVSRKLGLANGHFYGFRNRPSRSELLPRLGRRHPQISWVLC